MTALLAVRHDQDWLWFTVIAGLAVLSLVAAWTDWFRGAEDGVQRLFDAALGAVCEDHAVCKSDDCEVALCYNPDGPCDGYAEPGCGHAGDSVCEEHRMAECTGCREDARYDAGMGW